MPDPGHVVARAPRELRSPHRGTAAPHRVRVADADHVWRRRRCGISPPSSSAPPLSPGRHFAWAEFLRRIFEIDVLARACGRLRFIATTNDPPVVEADF